MREYYGDPSNCRKYVEDKNHKAIAWKDHPFSFELRNGTKYTLELKRNSYSTFATVEPAGTIKIQCDKWGAGRIKVYAKENSTLKCSFFVEYGCMIERNLVETIEKGNMYIAPVFEHGMVTIVECDNCGPNLGVKPKHDVCKLKNPAKMIKFINHTSYDLIISTEGQVIQRIEGFESTSSKCNFAYVGVPLYGILYIDTEVQEVAWRDDLNIRESRILRVNGCCMRIENGKYYDSCSITGPEPSEPYIRHLYVSSRNREIKIWCNTVDFRLD